MLEHLRLYHYIYTYIKNITLIACLTFFGLSGYAQTAELTLDNRSQIITPPQGSISQFCSDTGSNLTFRVNNSGPDHVFLATNTLVVTLTATGNTFHPSASSVITQTFTAASSSNSTTAVIAASGFANFDWPVPLEFTNPGTTTINVSVAASGTTDPGAFANNVDYTVLVLANPSIPTLTSNFGSGVIDICQGDSVILTASNVGDEYEFYRNSALLGPRQTSRTFTTSSLADGDVITVIAYFTTNCGSPASSLMTVNVESIPVGSLISDASNDTVCEGDDVIFTADDLGANPDPRYAFYLNGVLAQASSTQATYLLSSISADNQVVLARTYATSSSLCFDSDSITLRLNSVSGVNQIGGATTICAGADPVALTDVSQFVPDRTGATLSYQWQMRTGTGTFGDIAGATSATYDPGPLNSTTGFRRLIYSTFNGVTCTTSVASASSNIVTITTTPNAAAVVTTDAFNNTVCEGDDLVIDASSTTNAQRYQYYVNGTPQLGTITSTASFTLSSVSFPDNTVLTVRAYVGTTTSTCFDDATVTIRVNSFSGSSSSIGNSQNVCSGETPAAFTSLATPTIDRLGDGATFTYQWQLRTGSNPFSNILNSNSAVYTPTAVSTTTTFRRIIESTFN